MSMQSSKDLVAKIFSRSWRRKNWLLGSKRQTRSELAVRAESLEKRLALTINYYQPEVVAGEENWSTVYTDGESDVYVRHAPTINRALFVADNGGFLGEMEVPGFNSANRTELLVSVGAEESVDSAADVAGPYWAGTNDALMFPLPYTVFNTANEVSGTLRLSDGRVLNFTNGGAGAVISVTGSTVGILSLTATQTNYGSALVLQGVPLQGLTAGDAPSEIDVSFNRSTDSVAQSRVSPSVRSSAGGQTVHSVIDMTPDPTTGKLPGYVPGTLRGSVEIDVLGVTRVVDFQANSTRENANGRVPLSFSPRYVGETRPTGDTRVRSDVLYQQVPYNMVDGGTVADGSDRGGFSGAETYVSVQGEFDPSTGSVILSHQGFWIRGLTTINPQVIAGGFFAASTRVTATTAVYRDTGDNRPVAVTMYPGLDHEADLSITLPTPGSTASIESPVLADGGRGSGDVTLSATNVFIDAPLAASRHLNIPSATDSRVGATTEYLEINAATSANQYTLNVADDPQTALSRSAAIISSSGSLGVRQDVLDPTGQQTTANRVYVRAVDGDIFIEGTVNANEHGYVLSSAVGSEQEAPFQLTTNSKLTAVPTGRLQGGVVTVTLGNDTLGEFYNSISESVVDLRTDVERLRMQAGPRAGDVLEEPFPYSVRIREANDLIIDAVASASGPIDVRTEGDLDLMASVRTRGDITLSAKDQFVVQAPLQTAFGRINLDSAAVVVSSPVRVLDGVQNEERKDVIIRATSGDLVVDSAVYAINGVQLLAGSAVRGEGRIFGDVVEVESGGSIQTRTAANIVYAAAPGSVTLDELDAAVFEVRDAAAVSLTANGTDTPLNIDRQPETGLNGSELVSPAMYADVYGTSELSVAAPNGSVDVLHHGSAPLVIKQNAAGDQQIAAGSVVIRSTLAEQVTVDDVAQPLSGATQVRMATTEPLSAADTLYEMGDAGVYPTFLTTTVEYDLATGRIEALGGIEHSTIRPSDRVLIKNGLGSVSGDDVTPVDGSGFINGLYAVISSVRYDGVDSVTGVGTATLRLARLTNFDSTDELLGRRYVKVVDGDLRGQVFYSNGFDNIQPDQPGATPINVSSVPVQTGYVVARAATQRSLSAGVVDFDASAQTVTAIANGAIAFSAALFDSVILGQGDLVVLTHGVAGFNSSAGIYQVTDAGDVDRPWELTRYAGVDEDGDGERDYFVEGRVVVTEGAQRTSRTGYMFEVSYDSLHSAELEYASLKNYRQEIEFRDSDPDFDSGTSYRFDVGSENPVGLVTFNVTTAGGTNATAGSLGKMITALQDNTAVVSRLNAKQDVSFEIASSVRGIQLEQALPLITEPITFDGASRVSVDGSRITTTRDGAVVRTGSLLVDIGPVRPSQVKTARKLVRDVVQQGAISSVYGFEFGPGASGSILRNIEIGGFGSGAAVRVVGADGVLLDNLTIGRVGGVIAPNEFGIVVQSEAGGAGDGWGTTINNSSVVASTEAGIRFDTNTDGVRIVDSDIGAVGVGNRTGVVVDPGGFGRHLIGVAPILPNTAIINLPSNAVSTESGVVSNQLSIEKNTASDVLDVGHQFYDRAGDRLWTVSSKTAFGDPDLGEEQGYIFTLAGPSVVLADADGVLLEAGYFVSAVGRSESLQLPAAVPVDDLYLGQRIAATLPNVIAAGTRIASIRRNADGTTTVGLTNAILDTRFTAVVFDSGIAPTSLRNNIGFNEEGVRLASGSSRVVRTDVHDAVFDGIYIDGVAAGGSHEIGGSAGISLAQQNAAIYSNQLAGIRISEDFFAGLGNTSDRLTRASQVVIQGNFLGTNVFSAAGLSNGLSEPVNIRFDLLDVNDVLVGSTERGADGRYTAKYRPEDNRVDEDLAEVLDRDSEGNFHYAGSAVTIDPSLGGGFTGGGSTGGGTSDSSGLNDTVRTPTMR